MKNIEYIDETIADLERELSKILLKKDTNDDLS